jgi:ribose transport system substrate-binding protein
MGRRWFFAAIAALVLVAGCASRQAPLFVIVPKSTTDPFWMQVARGMNAAAVELRLRTEFLGPKKESADKQLTIIKDAIARHPAGLAIAPSDPSRVRALIDEATRAGIPTITVETDVPQSARACFVGTDNYAAGKVAGENMAERVKSGAVAILADRRGDPVLDECIRGFREAIRKGAPRIAVLGPYFGEGKEPKLAGIGDGLLSGEIGLKGIFAPGPLGSLAVGRAVKKRGRLGEAVVVGFGTLPEELALLREGAIQVLIGPRPYETGYWTLRTLSDLYQRKPPPGKVVDTGVDAITRKNVDELYP